MLTDTQALYLRAFENGPVSAEEKGLTWTVLIKRGLVERQDDQLILTEAGAKALKEHFL